MFDLNKVWAEFQCPQCNYLIEVQFVDIKSEKSVFCHNCKVVINLNDSNASVHTGIDRINNALDDLNNRFK